MNNKFGNVSAEYNLHLLITGLFAMAFGILFFLCIGWLWTIINKSVWQS